MKKICISWTHLLKNILPDNFYYFTLEINWKRLKKIVLLSYLTMRKIFFDSIKISSIILPQKKQNYPIKKILIVRTDGLGDLILTIPLFISLKKMYLDAEITLLTNKNLLELADLFITNNFIDKVYSDEELLKQPPVIYDIIIDPIPSWNMNLLITKFKSKRKVGFDIYGKRILYTDYVKYTPIHASKEYKLLLKTDHDIKPTLKLDPKIIEEAKNILIKKNSTKKFIFIHTGARFPSQKWNLTKFIALSERLSQKYNLIIYSDVTHNQIPLKNVILIDKLSLKLLAAFIYLSILFIGNNSGPLHLANALGKKTLSTLGPTNPVRFFPEGNNNTVIMKKLPCIGCEIGWCSHHSCMELITVDEMYENVINILKND